MLKNRYFKAVQTARGIVLRKTKLTETSLIVTWFTAENGKLKTVAKGARRTTNPVFGKLDLFYQCEFQFLKRTRTDLCHLGEVRVEQTYECIRHNYTNLRLAAYFAELIEHISEPEHSLPELFDLLKRGLGYLNEKPANRVALFHFENELVKHLGLEAPVRKEGAARVLSGYAQLPVDRESLVAQLP